MNKNVEKENFFSNMFHSVSLDGAVKLSFAVNLKNLYLNRSKYQKVWDNIYTEDKIKIFTQDTFKKITLCRRRLKAPALPNSPATIFDESSPIEIVAEGSFNQNFALSYGKQMGRFGRIRIDSPMENNFLANII